MQLIKSLCYNKDMGKKNRGGFTLIELSLSLIFIALLSLAVVFLIQNLTASYRRGLILNQVNTLGMDLIDDFRISVQNANSEPITKMCIRRYGNNEQVGDTKKCIDDNARSFVSVTKYGTVTINGASYSMPIYGAFCTGTYTYIWNTGYFEKSDVYAVDQQRSVNSAPATLYAGKLGDETLVKDNFRLLKVYDSSRSVCVNAMKAQNGWQDNYIVYNNNGGANYNNNIPNNRFYIDKNMLVDLEAQSEGGVVELLKKEGQYSNLVLYDMYVAKPALSLTRENIYYAASFILGTIRGGININVTGSNCRPTNDNYSEIDYCAINKFNFGVAAGGY